MKISPNLYGRMDGSKFWRFPWFPENFLLYVILRYTVYLLFSCRYIYLDLHPFLSLNPETEIYFEHTKILINIPFWKASYFWLYIKQINDTSTLHLYLVSGKSLKFLLAARQVWCCLQLCLQRQQAKCKSHVFFPCLLKVS